jgi:hypothetical protein
MLPALGKQKKSASMLLSGVIANVELAERKPLTHILGKIKITFG